MQHSPFDLTNHDLYQRWREYKLRWADTPLEGRIVEIRDPRHLTSSEYRALLERCQRYNFALYRSTTGNDPDPQIPLHLGRALGLQQLDRNWLGDQASGLTRLTVRHEGVRQHYIPYTNHPIRWHTDGYYNPPERNIYGLILHCVECADGGGDNGLYDHELAYLQLRDEDPDYLRALMRLDAMTIPPRQDEQGTSRPAQSGPVFAITREGELHMRFTERQRNIAWHPELQAAVTRLRQLLENHQPALRGYLQPGMGLVCNNILHDRSGFASDSPRLLYRGRYYDRIANTGFAVILGR